jgi:hypothetical protein
MTTPIRAFTALALTVLFAGCGETGPTTSAAFPTLDSASTSLFARLALRGITREYPNKLDHVMNDARDVRGPRDLHPSFYGSYDWHSSVHGHWMLVRLLKVAPDLPESAEIRRTLDANLSAASLAAEAAYLGRPGTASFERMYGWAWLLKLAEELHGWDDADGRRWEANLQPLTVGIVARYLAFLPKQVYPIRRGVHPNTAFGMALALDYARAVDRSDLDSLLVERSRTYFGNDVDVPAEWEPDGDDFLSRALVEADLMRRVLPAPEFARWFHAFLPDIAHGDPANLLEPAQVTDRADPGLVHLDGLNLSRAWCMRAIAAALPDGDASRPVLRASAARHAEATLPYIASGNYLGEHWLASFAVYMLTAPAAVEEGRGR